MSVLLCFSTKETVSEPYKVEPYTFHVCCLFVFLKRFLRVAFSGRAGVAGRQPPRLPCRMKQKGIFFFIRYKSIKHHLLANTAISHTPTHTHTHTHGQGPAHTHTHTHVHNVKCEWIQGLAVVVGAMVNLVVALML